jgi:hypothetical protein
MQDGADGPAVAVENHRSKDTYWNLLQDAACRSCVRVNWKQSTPNFLRTNFCVPLKAHRQYRIRTFSELVRRFISSTIQAVCYLTAIPAPAKQSLLSSSPIG